MGTDAIVPKQIKVFDHPNSRVAFGVPAMGQGKISVSRHFMQFHWHRAHGTRFEAAEFKKANRGDAACSI
jgi:hypothetical protein